MYILLNIHLTFKKINAHILGKLYETSYTLLTTYKTGP